MTLIKDYFDLENAKRFTQVLQTTTNNQAISFSKKQFLSDFKSGYVDLELKQRVELIADLIHKHLDVEFNEKIQVLTLSMAQEEEHVDFSWTNMQTKKLAGFNVWPLTEYVRKYGKDNFDISMHALYEMTKRFSSEFAIRDFINLDQKRSYQYFDKWIKDSNHHVRRLVSEGTRPLLPWAPRLDNYNQFLKKNIKILNTLKTDNSEYVRRSVANHFNDISKIKPDIVIDIISKWNIDEKNLQRLSHHALRTLIKQGHPRALNLIGYGPLKFKLSHSKIKKNIKLKENVFFDFEIEFAKKYQNILIDYSIYFMKANGTHSKKVFKHRKMRNSEKRHVDQIKLNFKQQSTRKLYPGKHLISLIVNGKETKPVEFNLKF